MGCLFVLGAVTDEINYFLNTVLFFFTDCTVRIKTTENKICTQSRLFWSKYSHRKVTWVSSQAGKVVVFPFLHIGPPHELCSSGVTHFCSLQTFLNWLLCFKRKQNQHSSQSYTFGDTKAYWYLQVSAFQGGISSRGNWGMVVNKGQHFKRRGCYQTYEFFWFLVLFVQARSVLPLVLYRKPDWKIICKSVYNSCQRIKKNLYFYMRNKKPFIVSPSIILGLWGKKQGERRDRVW